MNCPFYSSVQTKYVCLAAQPVQIDGRCGTGSCRSMDLSSYRPTASMAALCPLERAIRIRFLTQFRPASSSISPPPPGGFDSSLLATSRWPRRLKRLQESSWPCSSSSLSTPMEKQGGSSASFKRRQEKIWLTVEVSKLPFKQKCN